MTGATGVATEITGVYSIVIDSANGYPLCFWGSFIYRHIYLYSGKMEKQSGNFYFMVIWLSKNDS